MSCCQRKNRNCLSLPDRLLWHIKRCFYRPWSYRWKSSFKGLWNCFYFTYLAKVLALFRKRVSLLTFLVDFTIRKGVQILERLAFTWEYWKLASYVFLSGGIFKIIVERYWIALEIALYKFSVIITIILSPISFLHRTRSLLNLYSRAEDKVIHQEKLKTSTQLPKTVGLLTLISLENTK